ncbi:MAG: tRNA 2-thiouridine(34) synthase MnmA, partial [Elusimicrobiota bacterium]|nr:tRNA 2-thiouridine(34) synthase MnmA [Elusimicrobiota bacterium]
ILRFPNNPGDITDKTGKVIGRHEGVWNYTIGKRKGLTGGGTAKPLYVIKINPRANQIIVGYKEDLYSQTLTAGRVNWVSIAQPENEIEAQVKIRRQHKEAAATISVLTNGKVLVKFKEPQMSVTAGQSAVFYKGDIVLGGGIIES